MWLKNAPVLFLFWFDILCVLYASLLEPSGISMPGSDDGFTDEILIEEFPFLGGTYTSLYICTNGFISFDAEVKELPSGPFPSTDHPVIAPFWADIDTRFEGTINYRIANASDLTAITNCVNVDGFNCTSGFIVTWISVLAVADSGPGNTFQLALCTDGISSFVIFNYQLIEWTSDVQIGFDAGDNSNYYTHEYSNSVDIINLTVSSNVGVGGRYVYQVDDTIIDEPEIFLVVFTTEAPWVPPETGCAYLEINSGTIIPQYSGNYSFVDIRNDRRSYTREFCSVSLYYRDTPAPLEFWLFGPDNGGPRGPIMGFGDAINPWNISEWLAYDESAGKWVPDHTVTITCVPEEGEDCENACNSSPCENGGNCTSTGCGTFSCTCPMGVNGDTCQCPATFTYDAASDSCLYFYDQVTSDANGGAQQICAALDDRAQLVAVNSEAENSFILKNAACTYGKYHSVENGDGRLDCPIVDQGAMMTCIECRALACKNNANAYNCMENGICQVVQCSDLSNTTLDTSGDSYNIYKEVAVPNYAFRRTGTDFNTDRYEVTGEPLQVAMSFTFEVSLSSDTTTCYMIIEGESGNFVRITFNVDIAILTISSSNISNQNNTEMPVGALEVDASTSYPFWVQWDSQGNFTVGTGRIIGESTLIHMVDPYYNELDAYLNTIAFQTTDTRQTTIVIRLHACDCYWTSGYETMTSPQELQWRSTNETLGPYTNWATGQPTSSGVDKCVAIDGDDGTWIMASCATSYCFACEIDMD